MKFSMCLIENKSVKSFCNYLLNNNNSNRITSIEEIYGNESGTIVGKIVQVTSFELSAEHQEILVLMKEVLPSGEYGDNFQALIKGQVALQFVLIHPEVGDKLAFSGSQVFPNPADQLEKGATKYFLEIGLSLEQELICLKKHDTVLDNIAEQITRLISTGTKNTAVDAGNHHHNVTPPIQSSKAFETTRIDSIQKDKVPDNAEVARIKCQPKNPTVNSGNNPSNLTPIIQHIEATFGSEKIESMTLALIKNAGVVRAVADRAQCIGLVNQIIKPLCITPKGRSTLILTLVDETIGAADEFRCHFFTIGDDILKQIETGDILRLQKVKLESYKNEIDGRVFDNVDILLYKQNSTDLKPIMTSMNTIISEKEKKRVQELKIWFRENKERLKEDTETINIERESNKKSETDKDDDKDAYMFNSHHDHKDSSTKHITGGNVVGCLNANQASDLGNEELNTDEIHTRDAYKNDNNSIISIHKSKATKNSSVIYTIEDSASHEPTPSHNDTEVNTDIYKETSTNLSKEIHGNVINEVKQTTQKPVSKVRNNCARESYANCNNELNSTPEPKSECRSQAKGDGKKRKPLFRPGTDGLSCHDESDQSSSLSSDKLTHEPIFSMQSMRGIVGDESQMVILKSSSVEGSDNPKEDVCIIEPGETCQTGDKVKYVKGDMEAKCENIINKNWKQCTEEKKNCRTGSPDNEEIISEHLRDRAAGSSDVTMKRKNVSDMSVTVYNSKKKLRIGSTSKKDVRTVGAQKNAQEEESQSSADDLQTDDDCSSGPDLEVAEAQILLCGSAVEAPPQNLPDADLLSSSGPFQVVGHVFKIYPHPFPFENMLKLVSGFCQTCASLTIFTKLSWIGNPGAGSQLIPYCPCCEISRGKKIPVILALTFAFDIVDASAFKINNVIVQNKEAEHFLGCTVKDFVKNKLLRTIIYHKLNNLLVDTNQQSTIIHYKRPKKFVVCPKPNLQLLYIVDTKL